jgi:hypothetical protein
VSLEKEYDTLDKGDVIEKFEQGMSPYLGLFIMCFWWGVDTDGCTSYNPGVHMITAFSIEIFLSGLKNR